MTLLKPSKNVSIKKHKGYWFLCTTIDGETKDISGFKNLAEATYMMNKYERNTRILRIELYIGTKHLQTLERKGNELKMTTKFEAFYDDPKNHPTTPYLDGDNEDSEGHKHPGPGKEFMVTAGIPFVITQINLYKAQWGDNFSYKILLDQISPEYVAANNVVQLEPEYIMSMGATDFRKNQKAGLLDDAVKSGEKLMLVKRGKNNNMFDFSLYVPKKKSA